MIRKIRCPHCGAAYWQGRKHVCPPDPNRPRSGAPERLGDAVADAGCALGRLGCCLAEMLPWGCLLPAVALLAIARLAIMR